MLLSVKEAALYYGTSGIEIFFDGSAGGKYNEGCRAFAYHPTYPFQTVDAA
jgi:hypothetical protein